MTQSQRILVCLRYGIGDAVMEMPALRGLRSALPTVEILLLGARPALELFEGDPDFQDTICVQDFGFRHWGDLGDDQARDDFQRWFASAGITCVLDPFHAVSGVQETLTASGLVWRNSSPTPRVPERLTGGHGIAAIWYGAMKSWGLDEQQHHPPLPPRLYIPKQARLAADRRLSDWRETGKVRQEIVGVAPIASSELKRWPLEGILQVIDWLVGERGRRVLVFGVGSEQDLLLARLRKAAGNDALAIVAPTHLQETAALASRCQAFLSNDTGLMHIAAAVDTPTVGIFGPTAAHIYLPSSSLAVASERPCDYRLNECFGPPQCVHANRCLIAPESCIDGISTASVSAALDALLQAANDLAGSWPSPQARGSEQGR